MQSHPPSLAMSQVYQKASFPDVRGDHAHLVALK